MHTVTHHTVVHVVPRTCLVTTELIHSLDQGTPGLTELNHARLKVVQRPLNKAVLLLVMSKKVVPERMLQNTRLSTLLPVM